MLSSTWLTVTIAVSRYIAICHPLQARQIIGKTFTIGSLVAVILISVWFNIPRFLVKEPKSIVTGGHRVYFVFPGPLQRRPGLEHAYSWTYFTLGIAMPLCVLVFSNVMLVVALRGSRKLRAQTSFQQPSMTTGQRTVAAAASDDEHRDHNSASRITLTLVIIIAFFILLFIPAELLDFFMKRTAVIDVYHMSVFNTAQAIGNLLQSVNFAFNFVLYCVVNRHFRRTVYRLARCAGL